VAGQTSLQRRFDWPAFLEMRKQARQSASCPNLYGDALNALNRIAAALRRSPSPPATSFRLPIRFRALSASAHHQGHGDPEVLTFPPHITASPRIKRGNHPPQIKSLAHSRNLRTRQIIGYVANRTFSAVAFTRIPAEEIRMKAHTMRMGYRVTHHP
jgi:hypothetical protein